MNMDKMKSVTCLNCRRVSFAVSKEYIKKEVRKFNIYYEALSTEDKKMFGGPSSESNYEKCIGCGGSYKDFRLMLEGECPIGCTVNPIKDFEEGINDKD